MAEVKFVSVITVNYNSGSYAKTCINSLLKQSNINLEIIVVDNASVDGSVKILKESFGDKITLLESKENLGFGRANNWGASKAKGEFLLLLNPDTEIADNLAICKMIDFLELSPQTGMIGPRIYEPRKNKFVKPRLSYPSSKNLKFNEKLQSLPGVIAWLLGACLLIRRDVYEEISGFDSDYFLYGEDADIGLRIRQHGYKIGYCEDVVVNHVSGTSELGADSLDKWLRKKRGIFLFYMKHYDRRDVLKIAKRVISNSNLYLKYLSISALFQSNNMKFTDKKHRLEASVIVAKEAISQMEIGFK